MRYLLGFVSLIILGGCASVPVTPARAVTKQVEPLSEVVLLQCSKFKGAIVVLPDGTLEPIGDVKAARVVYDALPEGHRGVVETGSDVDCAPSQPT